MIILVLITFLLTRLFVLLTLDFTGNIETLYIGTITHEILNGLSMPFWDYQFSSYDGGGLISAIFLIPFFKLWGPVLFSLSFAAICISMGTLALWYLFLAKNFSRKTALLFSAIFICSPYVFTRWSTVLAGNHMEINFLNISFLYLFYNIFWHNKKQLYHYLALGFVAGLSTWFCYSFLVILFVCTMFWYVCEKIHRNYFKRLFVLGFCVGISPILFRLTDFFPLVYENIFSQIVAKDALGFAEKIKHLFHIEILGKSPVFLNLYWGLFCFTFILLIFKNRKILLHMFHGLHPKKDLKVDRHLKEVPIIMFPVLYLIIYGMSGFDILAKDPNYLHYRYLLPVFPFIFATFALYAAPRMTINKLNSHIHVKIILMAVILFGLADNVNKIKFSNFPNVSSFQTPGYSYEMLGTVLSWRFGNDHHRIKEVITNMDTSQQSSIYKGLGFELSIINESMPPSLLTNYLINDRYRRPLIFGYVLGLGTRYFENTTLGESYPIILQETDPDTVINYFRHSLEIIQGLAPQKRSNPYRGLGIQYSLFSNILKGQFDIFHHIPNSFSGVFHSGVKIGQKYYAY